MGGQYIEPMLELPPTGRWPGLPRAGGQCAVCRGWTEGSLCSTCAATYAAPRPRCARCGLGLPQALPACGECLRAPPPFSGLVAWADYGFPWDQLLARFKYQGQVELAAALAESLAQAVRAELAPTPERWPQLVLPVPLNPQRLRARGYNQAWELARRVAARLALPAEATLLQRLRDTGHQTQLTRAQRENNLRHAFWVDPREAGRLAGRRLALVDDVLTTGATAAAATQALLAAGAAEVQVWVLARTPAPGEG
jgi:ComF family protein